MLVVLALFGILVVLVVLYCVGGVGSFWRYWVVPDKKVTCFSEGHLRIAMQKPSLRTPSFMIAFAESSIRPSCASDSNTTFTGQRSCA